VQADNTFNQAADTFSGLVSRIPDDVLRQTGLGEWDVQSLIGHTARAVLTVETYLDRPAETLSVVSAAHYYALAATQVTDPAAVTERGRQAGRALGDAPGRFVAELVARVEAKLHRFDQEYQLTTIAGGMLLGEYLRTRTFELVVHSLDIATATGLQVHFPPIVLADALLLAGEIAVERAEASTVLLALTGRGRLPDGFSLV
jgi:uncharacterized protein (TIGR03083 family)